MGELNLSRGEHDAINAIDTDELDRLLEECLQDGRSSRLHQLGLSRCGQYVSAQLREFERALGDFALAKSAKKVSETEDRARRAASNLEHAVLQMKHRSETEQKEDLLFHVDDNVLPPSYLTEQLAVDVSYRWRRSAESAWAFGYLTVTHDAKQKPDFSQLAAKRKPSAAKREDDLQTKLFREWEHLVRLVLHSLKEYFRNGGDGASIPRTFKAKVDPHTQYLNNFSANFWEDQPGAGKEGQ